jgi:magnesium transporter
MSRPRKRYQLPGTSPGTLRKPEVSRVSKVTVRVMDYGPDAVNERELAAVEECFALRDTPTVAWIDVNGLQDLDLIQRLGSHFRLHPLALEDVLNTGQRPKLEEFDEHCFIVMKELRFDHSVQTEQISLFLGKGWVITLQEAPGDPFEPVRERIRKGKGRIRRMGADYLVYALIDALVDGAFPILEKLGERLEDLEKDLVGNPNRKLLQEIYDLRRELLYLRRATWPQREVIHALQREDSHLVQPETRVYLRDCYDHTIQILDLLETYRDLAAGMLDLYLSSVSNRLNEIMKVLTVMSSIFIPLTFLAGVYGMNFNPAAGPWSMPELNWAWGYPAVLVFMLGVVGLMLYYFRRKRWL